MFEERLTKLCSEIIAGWHNGYGLDIKNSYTEFIKVCMKLLFVKIVGQTLNYKI